jgi:hypothetical protein
VTNDEHYVPVRDLTREAEQNLDHVVAAIHSLGGDCPAHSGKIGINAAQSRDPREGWFKASLSFAVIDAGAVEHQ